MYDFRTLFIVLCVNKMVVSKLPEDGESAETCSS